MSATQAVAAPATPARVVTARPARALVPTLALLEARRLLRHPVTVVGFAVYAFNAVLTAVDDQGPRSAFETTSMILTFYPGMLLVLSANLVATRDRRADSDEMLAPLPGRPEERVKALALASLAPALVGTAATLALHAYYLADDRYRVAPGVWHLVQGPVTLVGACLFGTMLAVWVPARTGAAVGLVAMVVVDLYLDGEGAERLFGTVVTWAAWGQYAEQWAGVYPGSAGWHVGYLVALCAMAFAAAWVRVADRRTPAVVVGLIALAAAVGTGIAQLP